MIRTIKIKDEKSFFLNIKVCKIAQSGTIHIVKSLNLFVIVKKVSMCIPSILDDFVGIPDNWLCRQSQHDA